MDLQEIETLRESPEQIFQGLSVRYPVSLSGRGTLTTRRGYSPHYMTRRMATYGWTDKSICIFGCTLFFPLVIRDLQLMEFYHIAREPG